MPAIVAATERKPQSLILRILGAALFYVFALINWTLYLVLALKSGTFFKKPSEQERLQFAIYRDQFWNLSKQPISGFEHAFFTLRSGLRLHYLTNRPILSKDGVKKTGHGNLFIFIHGFPDSSMMWRLCLQEPAIPIHSARIVCLDLPNYGGSDSFSPPDTSVLEAVTEFIVAMREEHENAAAEDQKTFGTVVVAHDWGCVISYRLAAEAPQLADRFVLSNGPHIGLSLANKDRVLASSSKIFKQFQANPVGNFSCFNKSLKSVKPLLVQLLMFGYIFVFQLPKVMVKYLGSGGNLAFYSGALRMAHGRHKDEWNKQASLASTLGPGPIELDSKTRDGESYGVSVHQRAKGPGEAFWHQTAYYRHGLATAPWLKSLETMADLYNLENDTDVSNSPIRRKSSSASSALFVEHYEGALKAPATIMWGVKDQALTRAICLDGIGDYLAKASEVILLPQTAHWSPVEKESRAAIAKVVGECAASPNMPAYFNEVVSTVYEGTTVLAKR